MYQKDIERAVQAAYDVARAAREKGLDPVNTVEIPIATNLPERVTGIVSTLIPQIKDVRIERRIKELEKEYGFLDPAVAFAIALEIAEQKYSKFQEQLEAIEAGIRVGFAYLTLGSVSSPLEGFTRIEIKKNSAGEEYFAVYYSGPIRSAGGTAASLSVLLADFLRKKFGYGKYDARENEIKRAVAEIEDYHSRITNLQYLPSEKEVEILASSLPVQISGDASEDIEVSNYKNIDRVETSYLRGGFCLVMAECLTQKAAKLISIIKKLKDKGFELEDWSFLEKIVAIQKKAKGDDEDKDGKDIKVATYIKDLVAGRPVFSHPTQNGGFRLRYGRTRASGYSAAAIHPALSYLTHSFIATGTQFRMERPGKSAAITFCDSIDGPIVRLVNKSVMKINSIEDARKYADVVEEIIYLGDILISFGDFYNRNHPLMPCGYCGEWWFSELKEKLSKGEEKNFSPMPSFDEAIEISRKYVLPLHPSYIFFWNSLDMYLFRELVKWLRKAKFDNELILPLEEDGKRALEIAGVEHTVLANKVVVRKSKAFLFNLGFEVSEVEDQEAVQREQVNSQIKNHFAKIHVEIDEQKYREPLAIVNKFSTIEIKDKCGTFIGARMGRPEKAKPRKLTGSPNVLFPVGDEGGRLRSVNEAVLQAKVTADFPMYYCDSCRRETIYFICEICEKETRKQYYCRECESKIFANKCSKHEAKPIPYTKKTLDIKNHLEAARKQLFLTEEEMPKLIKGVRGTSSASHIPEHLAKGILRAIFGLSVNKDGTIRVDLTELPLTHFKPREIGTNIEKLKELGYTKDMNDDDLVDENQICELKLQDIIVPICPESLDERIDDFFIRAAKFIDNLLVRFYKLKPYYNIKTRDDLVGKIFVCLSPHTSVGVASRVIGFSGIQGLYAHPVFHAAMRRDCDGDEAAIILLLDCLLNFSKFYLPAHRGATQDTPLILNSKVNPTEVDDMAFDLEICSEYPLELYRKAEQTVSPHEVKVPQLKSLLEDGVKNIKYTHNLDNINSGVSCSAYKKLATMGEKVVKQMEVAEKIRAVDTNDVARLIIERHFIRDIRGNLRKFSTQQFRCVKCNNKFRRPPLSETCFCGGRLIFTISEGGIIKYLDPALELAEKYNVPTYLKQSLQITKMMIESTFGKEKEKQTALQKWF